MTATASLKTRDRDTILQALAAGVVPRTGLAHIQVGRAGEVGALVRDIDRIADGGSAVRFVIGEYGAGKTFFLNLVRLIALERKCVTTFLAQGREAFADLDLDRTGLVRSGGDTHVLIWRGTAMNNVVAVALTAAGIGCEAHDLGVTLADTTATEARSLLMQLGGAPSAQALSEFVENLQSAKYDHLAPTGLLQRLWARRHAVFCDELPGIAAVAQTWPA